jgi:hypothetical protein
MTTTFRNHHPIEEYDPDALKYIKLIKASYFESSETKPPVPRNQNLPSDAFAEMTSRSILVATSHAWFWQNHPDPEGVKLKLLRFYITKLRKKYRETEIVIFDDWHSCPQWPRTKEEDIIFYKAMDHMNSMYLYCDVVLFLEAKLPDLDMTVRYCTLIPSNYSFGIFVDVTQFHGPESDDIPMKKNDIVVKPSNLDILKSTSKEIEISYLKRPFGRPNRIPPDERGWLYAERITAAVKVATAGRYRFDDIIISNNEDLRGRLYHWVCVLLRAAKRKRIGEALLVYQNELSKKRFTRPEDTKLVIELLENLVDTFTKHWNKEQKRQKSISIRAHEILLCWGEFSKDYIEEAGFFESRDWNWKRKNIWKILVIIFLTPLVSLIPFLYHYASVDTSSSSIFNGAITTMIGMWTIYPVTYEFAKIPHSTNLITGFIYLFIANSFYSWALREVSGFSIFPFEVISMAVVGVPINNALLTPKIIPIQDSLNNNETRWVRS